MKFRKVFLPIVLLTSFVGGCSNSIVESSSTPSSSSSSAPTTSSSSSQSSSSSSQSSSNSSSSSSVTTGDIITEEGRKEYNGYYSKIDNSLTGGMNGTLRTTLTSFIAPKAYFTYSGSGSGQLGKELCSIDEDPSNPDNMILFYTQKSIKKDCRLYKR